MERSATSRFGLVARTLTTAIVGLLAALACTPAAAWGADRALAGGETQFILDGALRREGITVKPLGPAKSKGRRLNLPVTSGTFDPDAGNATYAQAGGLKLVFRQKTAALRRLRLDSAAKALNATVAGRKLLLARLGGTEFERVGFDAHLQARSLPLTRAAARALSRALGAPGMLRPGSSLGSITSLGEPTEVDVSFGVISIGGPDTAFSKLRSLNVQMGIWGASERWGEGDETSFLFQTAPTAVTPDASSGVLESGANDGVTMQIHESPPRDMLLRGPRIDLAARQLSATVSPLSTTSPATAIIATLDYGGAEFNIRPKVGVFELMGIRAVANQFIADRLNERFATNVFQAGETLARITVTLDAR